VVLVGAPNVGKSSLLNKLAQEDIAIVTPLPGTTRDVVRATIQLHGVAVELLDTAGLRASRDPIEQIGMERSRAMVSKAHLVLIIEDCSDPGTAALGIEEIDPRTPRISVVNKVDLLPHVPPDSAGQIFVSARTGYGMDALRARIVQTLGLAHLEEGTFLARHRHVQALDEASVHVDAASQAVDLVLLAEELRLVQSALGQITGKVSTEDLLGEIFSTFCIGK
jgi:tRNA modification GTPase